MDRRYFMAANMVALQHDRRRLDKSVRGVLGAMGMRS
jgi:hypothetical protein